MSGLIDCFKDCAHQVGANFNYKIGKLIHQFGLQDFLENKLAEADTPPTIAVKALAFFCDEFDPHSEKFRFGVLTVGVFLNGQQTKRPGPVPQQALADLVALLRSAPSESQIRQWIDSHFT